MRQADAVIISSGPDKKLGNTLDDPEAADNIYFPAIK